MVVRRVRGSLCVGPGVDRGVGVGVVAGICVCVGVIGIGDGGIDVGVSVVVGVDVGVGVNGVDVGVGVGWSTAPISRKKEAFAFTSSKQMPSTAVRSTIKRLIPDTSFRNRNIDADKICCMGVIRY